jgi:hypothetical protein
MPYVLYDGLYCLDVDLVILCFEGVPARMNRAIMYAPGSSHAYIQQNYQVITTHITK